MVIATFLIVYFTCEQKNLSDQQTIIAEKQNQISKDIARISKQTLEISNSAYVVLDHVVPEDIPRVGKKFKVTGIFLNSGNTPAYNVLIYGQVIIRTAEPAEIGAIADTTLGSMMGSNGRKKVQKSSDFLITKAQLERLKNQTEFIFYLGTLTYRNIFGQLHCVEFCTIYHIKSNEFGHCFHNNEPCSYIENNP